MTSRRMLIKNKLPLLFHTPLLSAKTRRAFVGGFLFFFLATDLAIASSVQSTASATISSGVTIISDHEAGFARAEGVEFASYQVLGAPEFAFDCDKGDVCLAKAPSKTVTEVISFDFE